MRYRSVWGGRSPVVKGFHSETERVEIKREKHFQNKGPKRSFTDKQICEMRALRDFGGWTLEGIARRFGIDAQSCKRYVDGVTRAGLIHTEKDLPNG